MFDPHPSPLPAADEARALWVLEAPMLALLDELQSFDFVELERTDWDDLVEVVRPRVLSLADRFGRLLRPLEGERPRRDSGVFAPSDSTEDRLESTLFMITLELRQRVDRVRDFPDRGSRWSLLAHCGSVLRHLTRGACMVIDVVRQRRGEPPIPNPVDDLATSLETRRQYARLHRIACAPVDARHGGALTSHLLSTATAIAVLLQGRAGSRLRVDDRIQLRALRDRIRAWVRAGDGREGGAPLLSDVRTFCDLLYAVNRRQTLVDHDRTVVSRGLARLGEGRPADRRFQREMAALLGRDHEVDSLVRERSTCVDAWRRALRGVDAALSAPGW